MERAIKFFSVCLVVSTLCICFTILKTSNEKVQALNNDRYKVVGDKIFDTASGKYIIYDNSITTLEKQDISKVKILKDSLEPGRQGSVFEKYPTIKCTVQNDDTISHTVYVKIVYYDKNDSPLLSEDSSTIELKAGDIKIISIISSLKQDEFAKYTLSLQTP